MQCTHFESGTTTWSLAVPADRFPRVGLLLDLNLSLGSSLYVAGHARGFKTQGFVDEYIRHRTLSQVRCLARISVYMYSGPEYRHLASTGRRLIRDSGNVGAAPMSNSMSNSMSSPMFQLQATANEWVTSCDPAPRRPPANRPDSAPTPW